MASTICLYYLGSGNRCQKDKERTVKIGITTLREADKRRVDAGQLLGQAVTYRLHAKLNGWQSPPLGERVQNRVARYGFEMRPRQLIARGCEEKFRMTRGAYQFERIEN